MRATCLARQGGQGLELALGQRQGRRRTLANWLRPLEAAADFQQIEFYQC